MKLCSPVVALIATLLATLLAPPARADSGMSEAPIERVWQTPPPPRDTLPEEGLPGNSVSLGFGFASGGEQLAEAVFLKAGTGLTLNAGGKLTPLWVGTAVGFGLGAELGWKYTSVQASNGDVWLRRFPLVVSAHALVHLHKGLYLLAASGLHTEFGVQLDNDFASGLEVDLSSKVGGMGELGLYFAQDHLGLDGTIRYTALRYEVNGQSIDASNIGAMLKFHYNFF